jgi:hypothetical protein
MARVPYDLTQTRHALNFGIGMIFIDINFVLIEKGND